MLRRALLVALLAVAAIPIAAQGPAGWKVRPDETSAMLGAMSGLLTNFAGALEALKTQKEGA